MTFSEIVSRVVAATGRSDKQSTIEAIVNEEMLAIQLQHNLYFMEEVVGRGLLKDEHKYALPSDFKDWGDVTLVTHSGSYRPFSTITIESSSAGDTTQTATVVYLDYVGDRRTEDLDLNGQTAVESSATMAQLVSVTLSAACAGTLTIKDEDGTTLTTIAAGVTSDEYTATIDTVDLPGPKTQAYGLAAFGPLDSGAPEFFSDDRSELRVWPPLPDEDNKYSLRLRYYKLLPSLTGSNTNELTNRWPFLVIARTCAKFYSQLPNGAKEAQVHFGLADHPTNGMPGLIRYSNSRRLADMSHRRTELRPGARRLIGDGYRRESWR